MSRTKLFCLLLLLATYAMAQYTSGVEGTVVDQSGSPIGNAAVSVTNESTHVTTETSTSGSVYFRAPNLAPGQYQIEVRITGFENWLETKIQVDANQLRTVYPKLLVGTQKTEVEVSANVEAIETGKSSVATSIAQRTIEQVPMVGRNVYSGVAFIAPGV